MIGIPDRIGVDRLGNRENSHSGEFSESDDGLGEEIGPLPEVAAEAEDIVEGGSAHARSRRILTEIASNSAATGAKGLFTSTVTALTTVKVPRIRAAICWAKVSMR